MQRVSKVGCRYRRHPAINAQETCSFKRHVQNVSSSNRPIRAVTDNGSMLSPNDPEMPDGNAMLIRILPAGDEVIGDLYNCTVQGRRHGFESGGGKFCELLGQLRDKILLRYS